MPRLLSPIPDGTRQALLNTSFENLVVTWLMQDGWQVFVPMLDHGHKTDVVDFRWETILQDTNQNS